MSEEELRKNDILFQIDMQLYDEFNDELATMNDHIGDIYSYRDIEEVEQAEKEKERKLLREAIRKLQKENEQKQETIDKIMKELEEFYMKYDVISKDKIRELKQKLLEEGHNLTEEQRQKETEFRQGKLKAYEELLGENKNG